MARVFLYDPNSGQGKEGSWELISLWKTSETACLWVDAQSVSPRERSAYLEGELALHPLAVQDALRDRHPPKVERFDNSLFVMVRGLSAETTDIDFEYIEIALFLAPRLIVTRRTGRSINTDLLWDSVQRDPSRLEHPESLGLELIGRVIRRYIDILLELEPRLDQMESELFERSDDALLHELTRYRNRLKALRRIFRYHERVTARLMADGGVAKHLKHETEDVHDQATRGMSLSDFQYEVTSDMVDGYLALSSHHLNQVMRVLTLITVIFVPLSFIAGVYGMNFETMPELKSSGGYFVVLSTMAAIAFGLLVFFKRRGWLWTS